jgi:hypothetical protein
MKFLPHDHAIKQGEKKEHEKKTKSCVRGHGTRVVVIQ